MKKAIFLDRDGTINKEVSYLHEIEKLCLLPGVIEALRLLKEKGYLLIVVTNQSGVGRGYFSIEEVWQINEFMNKCLSEYNAKIDAFYCCPHAPEEGCNCRKPRTELYLQAVREWNIDLKKSYMVGDKVSDIIAASELECGYGLLLCGHKIEKKHLERYRNHCYENLLEFAEKL